MAGFDLSEALENPAFYILSGLGIAAVVIGWIASKKMELATMPFWQLIILIIGVLVASVFFTSE